MIIELVEESVLFMGRENLIVGMYKNLIFVCVLNLICKIFTFLIKTSDHCKNWIKQIFNLKTIYIVYKYI